MELNWGVTINVAMRNTLRYAVYKDLVAKLLNIGVTFIFKISLLFGIRKFKYGVDIATRYQKQKYYFNISFHRRKCTNNNFVLSAN